MNQAIVAALVAAVFEYPLAKRFPTTPPTNIFVRMAVVGGMAFVASHVAQHITKRMNHE